MFSSSIQYRAWLSPLASPVLSRSGMSSHQRREGQGFSQLPDKHGILGQSGPVESVTLEPDSLGSNPGSSTCLLRVVLGRRVDV